MKKILLMLVFGMMEIGYADDLADLKNKYDLAVKKAIEPLNKVYETELQRLLEKYSKSGDIERMERITEQLKLIQTNVFVQKNEETGNNKDLLRLIEGKAYKTPFGTTFYFEKGGQGWKMTGGDKSTFLWKVIEDDIVEWTGRKISASPIMTQYIKFSKKETFIGSSKDKIDIPLTQVK